MHPTPSGRGAHASAAPAHRERWWARGWAERLKRAASGADGACTMLRARSTTVRPSDPSSRRGPRGRRGALAAAVLVAVATLADCLTEQQKTVLQELNADRTR